MEVATVAGRPNPAAMLPAYLHQTLVGHEGSVMAVRYTARGQYALTCGRDRTMKLWNPDSGLCIKTYAGHSQEVLDAAAAADNSKVASVSSDKYVMLWDVSTGSTLMRFRGHTSKVNCVKFNADASVLITSSYDATVKVWDTRSKNRDPVMSMDDAKDDVPTIDVSDHEILAGSVDGSVRTYDMRAGMMHADFLKDPVTSVSFSHDRNCILAATLNSTIRLLDKESGEMLSEYTGHTNTDYKLDACLAYNDAYVVCGSETGDLCYWDLVQGKTMIHKVEAAHDSAVVSLSYHPKEHAMLTASTD